MRSSSIRRRVASTGGAYSMPWSELPLRFVRSSRSLFVRRRASGCSRSTRSSTASDASTQARSPASGRPRTGSPDPRREETRPRAGATANAHEAVDDANDVLLKPFACAVGEHEQHVGAALACRRCSRCWSTASASGSSRARRARRLTARRALRPGRAFALGVEEELILVDAAHARARAHAAVEALAAMGGAGARARPSPTPTRRSSSSPRRWRATAGEGVARARRAAGARCARPGATPIGAGIHPDGAFGDVVHVDERALRRDPRAAARPAAPHADLRAARPRRDARRRDRDPRVQRPARAPAAAAGAGRQLAVLARRSTPAWRPRAPSCSAATRAPTSRRPSRLRRLRGVASTPSSPPATCPTTRSCGGTCARTRTSARSRSARWTPVVAAADVAGLAALIHGLARARGRARRAPPWSPREALMESSSAPPATGSPRRCCTTARCARCRRSPRGGRARAPSRPSSASGGALEEIEPHPRARARRRPPARGLSRAAGCRGCWSCLPPRRPRTLARPTR